MGTILGHKNIFILTNSSVSQTLNLKINLSIRFSYEKTLMIIVEVSNKVL